MYFTTILKTCKKPIHTADYCDHCFSASFKLAMLLRCITLIFTFIVTSPNRNQLFLPLQK